MARVLSDWLLLKRGHRVAVLSAPVELESRLGWLPRLVIEQQPSDMSDAVVAFVRSHAESERLSAVALGALQQNGKAWFCSPKVGPGVVTDISEDCGWEVGRASGVDAVAQVSVEAVWTATRFRPLRNIMRRTRMDCACWLRTGGERDSGNPY